MDKVGGAGQIERLTKKSSIFKIIASVVSPLEGIVTTIRKNMYVKIFSNEESFVIIKSQCNLRRWLNLSVQTINFFSDHFRSIFWGLQSNHKLCLGEISSNQTAEKSDTSILF